MWPPYQSYHFLWHCSKPSPLFLPHAPSSSNLRQFSDNYSLLEEMWLAVSTASWVRKRLEKKSKTKQGDFHFPFSSGKQNAEPCGWHSGVNRIAAALLSLSLFHFQPRKWGRRGAWLLLSSLWSSSSSHKQSGIHILSITNWWSALNGSCINGYGF